MKEFTTLNGETILVNPIHIVMVNETSDGRAKLIFDSNISAQGDYEQKNYIFVKERFEWVIHTLSNESFDLDMKVPKRFN